MSFVTNCFEPDIIKNILLGRVLVSPPAAFVERQREERESLESRVSTDRRRPVLENDTRAAILLFFGVNNSEIVFG